MSSSTPRKNIEVRSEAVRELAYECIKEQKENPDVIVGMTPELLLAIADRLEELEVAEERADEAIFDDTFSIDEDTSVN